MGDPVRDAEADGRVAENVSLAARNTLRVAATARYLVGLAGAEPAAAAARLAGLLEQPRFRDLPRVVLGGGSNVLFVGNYPGLVIVPAATGIEVEDESRDHVTLAVAAGHDWHALVRFAVQRGWGGIENLSLIPGSVGAAPIQNIGAYGAQLSDVFVSLDAVALPPGASLGAGRGWSTLDAAACEFGYRDSVFKRRLRDRALITRVRLRLDKRPRLRLEYPGVTDELAAAGAGDRPSVAAVSAAVIRLRRRKLPDPERLPNAGSFFKNPVLSAAQLAAVRRRCPEVRGRPAGGGYKVAAAQLIERCGLRGRRFGRAGVADRHALVLVNHGGATGAELLAAARAVADAVADRFGVRLEPEVRVIDGEA